ncbi:MAG: RNA pseudouridine synthase [Spirochaetaceae bacterium]|jgi:23S rRNA pseudouridine955/2504/2580 synthase|nr:RNA pseudouridine synthase [Spirochaetaceae bacterium]
MKGITFLYEDKDCVALNKDAGISVQGGRGVTLSLDAVLSASCDFKPYLVHRLDKDTSGVMIVAKSSAAAAYFSAAISGKKTVKRYLAVCGRQRTAKNLVKNGIIESFLYYKNGDKTAKTRYGIISTINDPLGIWTFFELELCTGRTHQIRRHLSENGYVILGDEKYGDWALNKKLRKERALKRLLLHSSRLIMPLPGGGILDTSAPLPDYFIPFVQNADYRRTP